MTDYSFRESYFEGKWQLGSSPTDVRVDDPWTGETIATLSAATAGDVDRMFRAAAAAQTAWAAKLPSEKADVFLRAAAIMEARREEIVRWLVREAGSTRAKAQIEWWAVHNSVREAATLPSRVEGRILFGDYPGKENRVYRLPVGVVAVISPWNWPLHLSMRTIAPALALGNAVVVKPGADTPITGGLLIAKIFEEAGLPAGVLSAIVGRSREIGDPFVAHPASRVVSFTGSTAVGRHVAETAHASPRLKRLMLELGGNGPLIVTEDVDLERAVGTAIVGKFLHQGQMCIAANRIVVADRIHDAFVKLFVARTEALRREDPATAAMGPIINQQQLDTLLRLIARAKEQGARQLTGGAPRGLHLPPHVFDQVSPEMAIAREEIFGPLAPILRAESDDHAVGMANDTEYGLTSAVLCRDLGRAERIAKRLEAGMTHINDIPAVDMPQMPFGGEKNSGIGRFGSRGIIDELTTEHWISVQHVEMPLPF